MLIDSTCVGDVGFEAYFMRVASAAAFDLAVELGRINFLYARAGLLCFEGPLSATEFFFPPTWFCRNCRSPMVSYENSRS